VGLEEGFAVDFAVVESSRAAGVDEGDVGDSDEAEDGAQVGLDEVERGHDGGRIVDATGGDDEGDLLTLEQAFGGAAGVGEGLAGAGDEVDPELEDRGDGKIVHGDAEDVFVGGFELGDEGVGDGEELALLGSAGVFGGVSCSYPRGGNGLEAGGGKIAGDDLAIRVGLFPVSDELAGKVARDGGVTQRAGIDLEQVRHDLDLLHSS